MYLLELLNHRATASKLGTLVLTSVLASGLGLSGCSNDSSEGKEDEDSVEPSDDEDGDDSQEEEGSEDDGGSEDEDSQDEGETEGDESGGDEESDKDSEGDEEDPDGEESKDKDPDDEDPDKEDGPGEGEGEGGGDKPNRDCEKIQWGSGGVKKGQVVPRDDQTGYLDKDGDGKLETEETDVGMCQLHLTGKRCGLVITGFSG